MSPELSAFLTAQDLDELLAARQKVGELGQADTKEISAIVAAWRTEQPLANLLFHPALIPADLRLPALRRGLEDRQNLYFMLASSVGVQGVPLSELSEPQRKDLVSVLLRTIWEQDNVISGRASVSVSQFLSRAEAPEVVPLLKHPNVSVSHNLFAWLIKIFEPDGATVLEALIAESVLDAQSKNEFLTSFQEHLAKKAAGKSSSAGNFVFAYIPNLKATQE